MSGSDRVKPAGLGLKLTYDDFVLFPDDGKRHELIDGEHYVTPSPDMHHQQISMNLVLLIGNWLEQHRTGRLFHAPFDVVFSKYDVVEPDLLYVSNERSNVLTAPNVQGAPDLVIEIGSPGTRSVMRPSSETCTGAPASPNTGSSTRTSTSFASIGEAATRLAVPLNSRVRLATCSRHRYCRDSNCRSRVSSGSN